MKLFANKKSLARCQKLSVSHDLLSYPFKLFGVMSYPSGAISAEVSRSAVCIFQSMTNYIAEFQASRRPDHISNYGYNKYKPLLAIVPGLWYIGSGVYHSVSSLLMSSPVLVGSGSLSLVFLMFSLCVDFVRINKQLILLFSLSSVFHRMNFLKNYLLSTQRIDKSSKIELQKSLYSISGTSVALSSQALLITTNVLAFDILGQLSNAMLQIIVGSRLVKDSVNVLGGRGMSRSDLRRIKKMIQGRTEISKVEQLKTNFIGPPEVKLAGMIAYNVSALKDNMLLVLQKDIKKFAVNNKQELNTRRLLCKATDLIMTHTTEIVQDIEHDITSSYPEVSEIHLEMKYNPKK